MKKKLRAGKLDTRVELGIYEAIHADLESRPFESLRRLNSPEGFFEYLAKFERGGIQHSAVFWFEIVHIGDRKVFQGTDVFDITIVKTPTGKTLASKTT